MSDEKQITKREIHRSIMMRALSRKRDVSWKMCLLIVLASQRIAWPYPFCGCGISGPHKPETLYQAAALGDVPALQRFLSRGDLVNKLSNVGLAPLHGAAFTGRPSAVELLLSRGADVNVRDQDGETPLHAACRHGYHAVARLLLAKGADMNARDRRKRTPLHGAAGHNRRHLARLLLDEGADVSARSRDGRTSLMIAASKGSKSIVELLLASGADPEMKTDQGVTALSLVLRRRCGNEEIVALLTPHTDRELLKTPLYVFAALIVVLFVWLFRRRWSFFASPNWFQDTSNRRSMQMSVHELVDSIVEARILAPETPAEPGTANQAPVFTNAEWEQFREQDNSAGQAIGKILVTLFLYTVIIMSLVSWWTFRMVGP